MSLSQIVVLSLAGMMILFISWNGVKEINDPLSIYDDSTSYNSGSSTLQSTKNKIDQMFGSLADMFASIQPKSAGSEDQKLDKNVRFQQAMAIVLKVLGVIIVTVFLYVFLEVQKIGAGAKKKRPAA